MQLLTSCVRIVGVTLLICVACYTGILLAFAQASVAERANGSLIRADDGSVVGSKLIGQGFTDPGYFWPRPSAVDYHASGAGGSNKSPTSKELIERAQSLVARYGATPENPLPPELVAASGSGLDPHISEHAARYQLQRVAAARSLQEDAVEALIERYACAPGGALTPGRMVNVLELNLALDSLSRTR